MSLFDLHSLVSTEDFADAHEPLNDGVKKVPNAQTVAASTKTGDVGTDTTTAGPAKVIPEKKDNEDANKPEHTTVKESAERGGSDSKATPAAPKSEPAETDKDTGGDSKPKPFPPKSDKPDEEDKGADDKVEKEPLAHDTEKATKDELSKTEKAKEALEAYVPRAKTFDIIGHPKVQGERIKQLVTYVHRRSGHKAPATVSLESVSAAIELSQKRIAKLERDLEHFGKVSQENHNEPLVENGVVVEEPTETGGALVEPELAEGLTDLETDPLDVPMLEINRVQETIDVLTQGGAAVERYIEIIRSNPKMSKQAAAVLQAGLEHIDQICGLKVRATGMEGYLTTPRAAMEEADVKEKSLLDRAGEIGAKILKFIKELYKKGLELWDKIVQIAENLDGQLEELEAKLRTLKAPKGETTITLANLPSNLFEKGEFYGLRTSRGEEDAVDKLINNAAFVYRTAIHPIASMLSSGKVNSVDRIIEDVTSNGGTTIEVPGGVYTSSGCTIEYEATEGEAGEVEFDLPAVHEIRSSVARMRKHLAKVTDEGVMKSARKVDDEFTKAIIAYRKKATGDEAEFQKIQSQIIDNLLKPISPDRYSELIKPLVKIVSSRKEFITRLIGLYA